MFELLNVLFIFIYLNDWFGHEIFNLNFFFVKFEKLNKKLNLFKKNSIKKNFLKKDWSRTSFVGQLAGLPPNEKWTAGGENEIASGAAVGPTDDRRLDGILSANEHDGDVGRSSATSGGGGGAESAETFGAVEAARRWSRRFEAGK